MFNPYTTLKPASGAIFVGREAEIEKLAKGDQHSIVFGFSRWGKTSLMQTAYERAFGNGDDAVLIYSAGDTPENLLQSLRNRMRRTNTTMHSTISSAANLDDALLTLNQEYEQQGKRLRLFIDETRNLFSSPDVVQTFRGYHYELPNIMFNYAIFPDVFEQMQHKTSRFQDTATMVPLQPLTVDQTRKLVTLCADEERLAQAAEERRAEFTGAYVLEHDPTEDIVAETGGFPFLVQGLMAHYLTAASTEEGTVLTKARYDAAKESFGKEIIEQLLHVRGGLSDLQRSLLINIYEHDGVEKEEIPSLNGELPSVMLGAFNPLADKGLGILQLDDDGRYRIRGKLMEKMVDY